jgi:hypothetical protein
MACSARRSSVVDAERASNTTFRWTATFVLEKPAASKQSLSSGIPAFID